MSYDLSIVINTGGETPHEIDWFNTTYNLGPMYRRALAVAVIPDDGPLGGLWGLSGKSCQEAEPIIEQAIADMRDKPTEYREMEPANGWGTYTGAIDWLERVLVACREHPLAEIQVS